MSKTMTAEDLMVELAGHNPEILKTATTFEFTEKDVHLLDILHIVAPHITTIKPSDSPFSNGFYLSQPAKHPHLLSIYLKSLVVLNVSNIHLEQLPAVLPSSLIKLDCSDNKLTKLPTDLPAKLEYLNCHNNYITMLPDILPDCMTTLRCSRNYIRALPDKVPSSLNVLDCYSNKLSQLPTILPSNLIKLIYNNNAVSVLPDTLPDSITTLECKGNLIEELPWRLPINLSVLNCNNNLISVIREPLPPNLTELHISFNKLTHIADGILPISLKILIINNNKLTKLPDLTLYTNLCNISIDANFELHVLPDFPDNPEFDYTHIIHNPYLCSRLLKQNYPQIISSGLNYYGRIFKPCKNTFGASYINERNSMLRTQERTRIINANGALWEAYMKYVMHPKRFGAALAANEDLDIEEYTKRYIDAL